MSTPNYHYFYLTAMSGEYDVTVIFAHVKLFMKPPTKKAN